MKIMLDEAKKNLVFKPIQHFIQHAIISMLDEMLDWFTPVSRGKRYATLLKTNTLKGIK